MEWGQILALVAAALAVILPGMGSSKGVGLSGETASGVSTENPEVASKLLVLQLLPATQGIYGFLIAVIIMINTGALSGSMAERFRDPRTGTDRCGAARGRRGLLLRHPSGPRGRCRHADDRQAPRNER